MDTIIKFIVTVTLAGVFIALLPNTPFTALINYIGQIPMLPYIAWLFPVHEIVILTSGWVSTVISYFVVSWVLRQLDIIGQ